MGDGWVVLRERDWRMWGSSDGHVEEEWSAKLEVSWCIGRGLGLCSGTCDGRLMFPVCYRELCLHVLQGYRNGLSTVGWPCFESFFYLHLYLGSEYAEINSVEKG